MKDRLREALERLAAEWDERDTPGLALPENQEWAKGVDSGYGVAASELRDLLALHPVEPAPVASRETLVETAARAIGPRLSNGETRRSAAEAAIDALLAAGVFRDEAQVKAEALAELRVVTSGMSYFALAFGPLYHTREAAERALAALRAGEPS